MVNRPSLSNKLLAWLTLIRLGATARGVLPFLLGTVIAWSQGYPIDWLVLLLSSLAVICVMLMTFLINEYYDYDTDVANKGYHILSGGSRILAMGLVSRRRALAGAYVFTAIAIGIGLWLFFGLKTGLLTIPLGAIAIIIGYAYTARPFQLSYRGWGELSIWFACGWLATITGYYLQAGKFDSVAALVSLPGAFSIFLVILINEIPDITSDRISGKNTLAVRLGKDKAVILYMVMLVVCYANIIVIVFFGVPVTSAYFSIILLPLMIWIILTIYKKGLAEKKFQASLSVRTMAFDHLITIIYAVSFALEGLKAAMPDLNRLLMLAAAIIAAFGLEGLSLVFSRAALSENRVLKSVPQLEPD